MVSDVSKVAEDICDKRDIHWQLIIVDSSRKKGGPEKFFVTIQSVGFPQKKAEGPTVESATNLAIDQIGK